MSRRVRIDRGPAHGIVWLLVFWAFVAAGFVGLGWMLSREALAAVPDLPACADAPLAFRIHFTPAASGPTATGFRLYVSDRSEGYTGDGVDVGFGEPSSAPSSGPRRMTGPLMFDLAKPNFVVMTAYAPSAGGPPAESASHSLPELVLPIVPRCPPAPVPPPLPPLELELRLSVAADGTVTGQAVRP